MRTRVQRWGNSLAIRLPQLYAAALQLDHDSEVELTLLDRKLILTPVTTSRFTLDELLRGINEANIHQEVDPVFASAKEAW